MAIKKIEIRPKGDGSYSDVLYPKTSADMVETTGGTTVQAEIDNLKSSVSNGKNAIASAITDMGQNASGSDSFSTLANKIKDISKDATAGVGDVLSGKTFYQGGLKRTGNMPNRGAVVITPSTTNQAITAGYHNGNGYVKGDSNLIASNIKKNVSIFGVTGTYETQFKVTSGTLTFGPASSSTAVRTVSFSGTPCFACIKADLSNVRSDVRVSISGLEWLDTDYIGIAFANNKVTFTRSRGSGGDVSASYHIVYM